MCTDTRLTNVLERHIRRVGFICETPSSMLDGLLRISVRYWERMDGTAKISSFLDGYLLLRTCLIGLHQR